VPSKRKPIGGDRCEKRKKRTTAVMRQKKAGQKKKGGCGGKKRHGKKEKMYRKSRGTTNRFVGREVGGEKGSPQKRWKIQGGRTGKEEKNEVLSPPEGV